MKDVHDIGIHGKSFVYVRKSDLKGKTIGSADIQVVSHFSSEGPLVLKYDMEKDTLFTVVFVILELANYKEKVSMTYFTTGPDPTFEKEDDVYLELGEICAQYPLRYDDADECEDGWQLCDKNGRVIIKVQSLKTAHFLNSLQQLTPTPAECVVDIRQVDVGCQTDTPVCSWIAQLRDKIWNK